MLTNPYNPDVLSCLANLSSDEVFTPPNLANQMLDQLPVDLWKDPNAKFLDPFCKSGVFLREIAKRLIEGLENEFPDIQERINYIFKNQIYGIAITELTALLSRRSLYCSKKANSEFAVSDVFDDEQGNIRFSKTDHTWKDGKCIFCGASQSELGRDSSYESHAYEFIHTHSPEKIFDMKFDVIIGNPPYQLSDGGHGKSARPVYHDFVLQAIKLNPRFLTMITPSRWFGGGKGLNDFRNEMLNDDRIRIIVDHEDASECFPGVDIAGGISYFLWNRDNRGPCNVINKVKGSEISSTRHLNEYSSFIRSSGAVSIVRKVLKHKESRLSEFVSSRKPFGLSTAERPKKEGELILRWQKGEGPYPESSIVKGKELIKKWKVITSYVAYDHAGSPNKDGQRRVFSKIDIMPPGTICNETYLVIGSYGTELEATNLVKYMKTKFFRFLVSMFMYSHHITRESYSFVPILDMKEVWNDEKLKGKYNLSADEVSFMESKIKNMD